MTRRSSVTVYGLLAAFVLGSALPLYWSFVIGSHTKDEALALPPPLLPGGHFLANARRVLDTIDFWQAMFNSVIVSAVCGVSVVFFSTLAGYAFAKLRFRGSNSLMGLLVLTMAVPPQLAMVPLFILMREYNLLDTLTAVALPSLVTAFGVFFMRQYLVDSIPDELLDAATVDGCSMFRTFLTVGVPAARPAMAMLFLFTFMMVWTEYMWPLVALQTTATPPDRARPTCSDRAGADHGLRPGAGGRRNGNPSPLGALRPDRSQPRDRHHAGRRQGMSAHSCGTVRAPRSKPTPFGRTQPPDDQWLAKSAVEEPIDPDIPIVDAHVHLWHHASGHQYFVPGLRRGHRRQRSRRGVLRVRRVQLDVPGPWSEPLRAVGETEFAAAWPPWQTVRSTRRPVLPPPSSPSQTCETRRWATSSTHTPRLPTAGFEAFDNVPSGIPIQPYAAR